MDDFSPPFFNLGFPSILALLVIFRSNKVHFWVQNETAVFLVPVWKLCIKVASERSGTSQQLRNKTNLNCSSFDVVKLWSATQIAVCKQEIANLVEFKFIDCAEIDNLIIYLLEKTLRQLIIYLTNIIKDDKSRNGIHYY